MPLTGSATAADTLACSVRALILVLIVGCSRERRTVDAGSTPVEATPVDAAIVEAVFDVPRHPEHVTLEDACRRHDDCAAIDLFVDGPLRCCIACGAQAAANKATSQHFIAACSDERSTRECPVYECAAPVLDARCVGGHCLLSPRPR